MTGITIKTNDDAHKNVRKISNHTFLCVVIGLYGTSGRNMTIVSLHCINSKSAFSPNNSCMLGNFCIALFSRILLSCEIKSLGIAMTHLLCCPCRSFVKIFFCEIIEITVFTKIWYSHRCYIYGILLVKINQVCGCECVVFTYSNRFKPQVIP